MYLVPLRILHPCRGKQAPKRKMKLMFIGNKQSVGFTNCSDLCEHHSTGHRAGFAKTADHLASTLLKALQDYEKMYSFESLRAADIGIAVLDGVYYFFHKLIVITEIIESSEMKSWEDDDLEQPIKCKGTFTFLSFANSI